MVQRLAADAGVPVEVRDVDADPHGDPGFRARWTDHVPVVLLDGERHSLWYVDEAELATALLGRVRGSPRRLMKSSRRKNS